MIAPRLPAEPQRVKQTAALPKPAANVQAEFAMAGFEAVPLATGEWLIARWGLSKTLADIEAARLFLAVVTGRGAA